MPKTAKDSADPTAILNPRYRIGLVSSVSILVAYFGWFFVRSHITVASVVLRDEGILSSAQYARIQSVAFLCNAVSKAAAGLVVDLSKQPKYTFLIALLLCVGMALLNTLLVDFGWLLFFGSATRFLSAFGRVASLTIVATWFPKQLIGRMSGLINVGINFGELSARLLLGFLLLYLPWKSVFCVGAGIATALALPCLFLTSDKPSALNDSYTPQSLLTGSELLAEPKSSQETDGTESLSWAAATEPRDGGNKNFWSKVVRPLFTEPRFYCLLLMAVSTTAIRETFLQFSQSFFKDAVGASAANAGALTAVYNLPAAGSAFIGGFLLDKVRGKNRGLVPLVFLLVCTACLSALALFTKFCCVELAFTLGSRLVLANLTIIACSFALSAPNSFLDGAFVVDLAGAEGAAFASGFVGSFGYVGCAITSLFYSQLTTSAEGWFVIWAANALLCLATCFGSLVYWILDRKAQRHKILIPITYNGALKPIPKNTEASDASDASEASQDGGKTFAKLDRRRSSTAIVDISEQLEVFIVTKDD